MGQIGHVSLQPGPMIVCLDRHWFDHSLFFLDPFDENGPNFFLPAGERFWPNFWLKSSPSIADWSLNVSIVSAQRTKFPLRKPKHLWTKIGQHWRVAHNTKFVRRPSQKCYRANFFTILLELKFRKQGCWSWTEDLKVHALHSQR